MVFPKYVLLQMLVMHSSYIAISGSSRRQIGLGSTFSSSGSRHSLSGFAKRESSYGAIGSTNIISGTPNSNSGSTLNSQQMDSSVFISDTSLQEQHKYESIMQSESNWQHIEQEVMSSTSDTVYNMEVNIMDPVYTSYSTTQEPSLNFTKKLTVRYARGKVIVEAILKSDTEPNVTWTKIGKPFASGGRYEVEMKTKKNNMYVLRLKIHNVNMEDKGLYAVKARTSEGTAEADIGLKFTAPQVKDLKTAGVAYDTGSDYSAHAGEEASAPPRFVGEPSVKFARGKVIIKATLASDVPPSSVAWSRDGQPLVTGGRYLISIRDKFKVIQGQKLYTLKCKMTRVTMQDGGTYDVVASNSKGNATATLPLTLTDEKIAMIQNAAKTYRGWSPAKRAAWRGIFSQT